jgi:hypothetical protein
MRTETLRADARYAYGFGWWVDADHFGVREVYAADGTSVASAPLLLVRAEHLAVAIAANTGFPLNDIADDVVATYVPAFAAARRGRPVESDPNKSLNRPVAGLAGTWAGSIVTYRGRVPLIVRIDSLGGVHAGNAPMSNVAFKTDGRVEESFNGTLPLDEHRGGSTSWRPSWQCTAYGSRDT